MREDGSGNSYVIVEQSENGNWFKIYYNTETKKGNAKFFNYFPIKFL